MMQLFLSFLSQSNLIFGISYHIIINLLQFCVSTIRWESPALPASYSWTTGERLQQVEVEEPNRQWTWFWHVLFTTCELGCVVSLYLHHVLLVHQLAGVLPVVATLTLHFEVSETVGLSEELVSDSFTKQHSSCTVHPAEAVVFTRRKITEPRQRTLQYDFIICLWISTWIF